jgi:hypothetical protein
MYLSHNEYHFLATIWEPIANQNTIQDKLQIIALHTNLVPTNCITKLRSINTSEIIHLLPTVSTGKKIWTLAKLHEEGNGDLIRSSSSSEWCPELWLAVEGVVAGRHRRQQLRSYCWQQQPWKATTSSSSMLPRSHPCVMASSSHQSRSHTVTSSRALIFGCGL